MKTIKLIFLTVLISVAALSQNCTFEPLSGDVVCIAAQSATTSSSISDFTTAVRTAISNGNSGGFTYDPSTGIGDIVTSVVPRKAIAETIPGRWSYPNGLIGQLITGTPTANSLTCDSANQGYWVFQKDALTGRSIWACDGTQWVQQGANVSGGDVYTNQANVMTSGGAIDASSAAYIRVKVYSGVPSSGDCSTSSHYGRLAWNNAGTAGQQLYGCSASGWTVQGAPPSIYPQYQNGPPCLSPDTNGNGQATLAPGWLKNTTTGFFTYTPGSPAPTTYMRFNCGLTLPYSTTIDTYQIRQFQLPSTFSASNQSIKLDITLETDQGDGTTGQFNVDVNCLSPSQMLAGGGLSSYDTASTTWVSVATPLLTISGVSRQNLSYTLTGSTISGCSANGTLAVRTTRVHGSGTGNGNSIYSSIILMNEGISYYVAAH